MYKFDHQVSVNVEDRTQFLLAVLIPVFVVLVITGICGVCFWIRAKKEPPPLIPNDTYHLVASSSCFHLPYGFLGANLVSHLIGYSLLCLALTIG